ncbi:MAG: succinyldiaminopimelate transaminase [Gammaproteobacteria bacterium]|nr:succinyldiaminopimelate transaminase [Gammaproteobacteria bacterium]
MNPGFKQLQSYPFEKLAALLTDTRPANLFEPIALAVGEPRHPTPAVIRETLVKHLDGLANYPLIRGERNLREAIAHWLCRRFDLPVNSIDPDTNVLPVNGTREALFAIAQCVVDRGEGSLVLMPNPFYQIYEGAALLAGAQPCYLNCDQENGFLPDFDSISDTTWARCQLLYLCSPGNPAGAVIPDRLLRRLIELAEQHDFIIASDECYAEVYPDEARPPPGLLGAAARMGNTEFRRCLVFHSLSKRSNAPGLRSGFVAGDVRLIAQFARYRTYHGCAMPPPIQAASEAAWGDEAHVIDNRRLYREKFDAVLEILAPVLDVAKPAGGFYLWPRLHIDDQRFAQELYAQQNVTVLPGSFLSRTHNGHNPGTNYIRIALVAPLEDCIAAARRITEFMKTL